MVFALLERKGELCLGNDFCINDYLLFLFDTIISFLCLLRMFILFFVFFVFLFFCILYFLLELLPVTVTIAVPCMTRNLD